MHNDADEVRGAAKELREAVDADPVTPAAPPEDGDELSLAQEIRRLRTAVNEAIGALRGYRRRVRLIGGALAVALAVVIVLGAISAYSLATRQDNLKQLIDERSSSRQGQIQALTEQVDVNQQRTHDALCAALESPTITKQPDPTLHQLRTDLVCTPQLGDKK